MIWTTRVICNMIWIVRVIGMLNRRIIDRGWLCVSLLLLSVPNICLMVVRSLCLLVMMLLLRLMKGLSYHVRLWVISGRIRLLMLIIVLQLRLVISIVH